MKRSKRLKVKKEPETLPDPIPSDWERGVNSKGLPILPDELLLEILQYYPPIALPTRTDDPINTINTAAHVARRDMMLALSQSCSNLRRFFHPYIWERIEVCAGMPMHLGGSPSTLNRKGGKDMDKAFAEELIRQLEIVTVRDPTLAKSVMIANIEISTFAVHNVLLELGRCFDLFTNLHTVKLIFFASDLDTASRRGFQKYTYSNVKKLILSPGAYPLVKSCPNLRTLQCSRPWARHELMFYIDNSSLLERVNCKIEHRKINAFTQYLHSLVEIELVISSWTLVYEHSELIENLGALSKLTKLDVIIVEFICTRHLHDSENEIKDLLSQILRDIQAIDRRLKRILTCRSDTNDPVPFGAPMQEISIPVPTAKMKAANGHEGSSSAD